MKKIGILFRTPIFSYPEGACKATSEGSVFLFRRPAFGRIQLFGEFTGIADFELWHHHRVYHEADAHQYERNREPLPHIECHTHFEILLRVLDELYQET